MVEFRKIEGKPNYSEIIDLIVAKWPVEFGEASDKEKIAEMDNHYNRETDTVKYLYEDSKIIGFYRYSLWPREIRETKQAHTLDISLLPHYQRKGYGTVMMKDMIEECRNNGVEKLLSRSFKTNEGSVRLHKKMGFLVHFETDDSIVWELPLKTNRKRDGRIC